MELLEELGACWGAPVGKDTPFSGCVVVDGSKDMPLVVADLAKLELPRSLDESSLPSKLCSRLGGPSSGMPAIRLEPFELKSDAGGDGREPLD